MPAHSCSWDDVWWLTASREIVPSAAGQEDLTASTLLYRIIVLARWFSDNFGMWDQRGYRWMTTHAVSMETPKCLLMLLCCELCGLGGLPHEFSLYPRPHTCLSSSSGWMVTIDLANSDWRRKSSSMLLARNQHLEEECVGDPAGWHVGQILCRCINKYPSQLQQALSKILSISVHSPRIPFDIGRSTSEFKLSDFFIQASSRDNGVKGCHFSSR